VILSKAVDWDPWISLFRQRAEASRIWEFIDPDLPDKPAEPTYPIKPTLTRLEQLL
ncbi:hypothetical protein MMC07_008672, partial [Pseudocyphellaria aurata]|nr:hypothetical protein [Pseudocyphellaria aurata]